MRTLVGLLLLVWACLSWSRMQVWRNDEVLWTSVIAHTPDRPKAWVNLGRTYQLWGRDEEAQDAYHHALRAAFVEGRTAEEQKVTWTVVTLNQAIREATRGHFQDAVALAHGVVVRHPRLVEAHATYDTLRFWCGDPCLDYPSAFVLSH